MEKKTIVVAIALLVLLAGAGAYANTDEVTTTAPYGCYGHGQVALTDTQQEAMLELRQKFFDDEITWEEMHDEMQKLRAELGITGPGFVDEDGDGLCDNAGGYGKGYGRGPGGCGMGFGGRGGGYGRMGRW